MEIKNKDKPKEEEKDDDTPKFEYKQSGISDWLLD